MSPTPVEHRQGPTSAHGVPAPATEAQNDVGRPASRVETVFKSAISVSLVIVLSFIVVSNYLGWTARVEVASVKRLCPGDQCRQRVKLLGSGRAFELPGGLEVAPGDRVDVRGTCTPRCQLELTGVWPSAGGPRIALKPAGEAR